MSEIPKLILVKKILVNPNNPRFYEDTPSSTEIDAINAMIALGNSKILSLCEDIAIEGLMPNQSLIISPIEEKSNCYLAHDGNRRLTCIKLMTVYKNHLNKFNLSPSEVEKIKKLSCNIKYISCIVTSDKKRINQLLYRQHVAVAGISQVNWNSQVKAHFLANNNEKATKALAIARMITNSEKIMISEETIKQISNGGWHTKVDRLLTNKEYGYLLGIEFDSKNNIKCFFEKSIQENIILNFFQKGGV